MDKDFSFAMDDMPSLGSSSYANPAEETLSLTVYFNQLEQINLV
jgi:hypothetical protein